MLIRNLLVGVALCLMFTHTAFSQTTYTSQGSGDWNNLSNWDNSPSAADLISGVNHFVIQAGHVVTLNDSLNVMNLDVSGTLSFGNDLTGRNAVVNGVLSNGATGVLNISAFNATHTLEVVGGVVNNGSINFKNSSAQVVNLLLNGTQSYSGSGAEQLSNLQVLAGTVTAAKSLDIDGSFAVASGATFIPGNYTHTIAGSLSLDGTYNHGDVGTTVLDATLVQTISTAGSFNNLTLRGGGIKVLSGNLTVNGDFLITDNIQANTDRTHRINGNFTITDGSFLTANNGEFRFYGTSAQSINIGVGNAEFDRVYFANAGVKTVDGNLIAKDYSIIYSSATVEDVGDDKHHQFRNGLALDGTCNFSGVIELSGGNIRKGGDNSPEKMVFGNGADLLITGNVNLLRGDTLEIGGNFTIESGYIVLNALFNYNGSDTVESVLMGAAGNDFFMAPSTSLYIRGRDNFPQGFDNYTIEPLSRVYYDRNFPQTIKGNQTYGYLRTVYKDKTVTGPLTVVNNLEIYAGNNSTSTLHLGAFSHNFQGSLVDNPGSNRVVNIISTGDVNFNAPDANQNIYQRTTGVYDFNNLYFTNTAPTKINTKRIYGNVTVANNFSVSNSSGNELLNLVFDIDDGVITGGNNFTLSNNVIYRTSGTTNFKTTAESFAVLSLDTGSTIRFDGGNQNIPGGFTYGNLEIYGNSVKTLDANVSIAGYIEDVGYTPVFTSGAVGMLINIAGDWLLESNNVNLESTSTVTFNGDNQLINTTTLPNVQLLGTGTKTLNGNLTALGDITLGNGIEFDADNRFIAIAGNWDNNSTGILKQDNGRITFNGVAGQNISVLNPTVSRFYDLYIDNAGADTVYLQTDINVDRNFVFTQNRGDLNLGTRTLNIGGDWYIYTGCELIWNAGAKIIFDGNSTEQLIRNYNSATIYPDLKYTGSAIKRLYQTDFNIDGSFEIENATVIGEQVHLFVDGDWLSSGGTFNHNRSVTFDGAADQIIESTSFNDVIIAGTGSKKLNGNLTLSGWLRIDPGATLDASPDGVASYNLTIEEHWYNNEYNVDSSLTGSFIAREGTVTFVGDNTNIYTGDSIDAAGIGRSNKQFYNLQITNNSNNNYSRLYPIEVANVKTQGNDLRVMNNFTLNSGIFYTYWNDLYVGGDFDNAGGDFRQNEYRGINGDLILEGTTGFAYLFNPGVEQSFRKTSLTGGGEYQLLSNLTITGGGGDGGNLTVSNGILNLNHNEIIMESTEGDVTIETNGQMLLDSAAVLRVGAGRTLSNQGGKIEIIGNELTQATVTSYTGNFTFEQQSGSIAAQYFVIENTQGNGLDIQGGTIDASKGLSNGSFNGGTGNAYLTLDGIDLGTGLSSTSLVFSDGPTYNIQRTNGNGTLTLVDASGTLAGAVYENDPLGTLIDWDYPAGKFWDGGASTSSWHDAANWSDDLVPDATSNVYLNHDFVAGSYSIDVTTSAAYAKNIVIESGASAISLTLNGNELTVVEDFTIKSNGVFTQTNSSDTLHLNGNWFNAGVYNPNTGPILFNIASGVFTLDNTDPMYRLFISGEDGILNLGSDITIQDSISLMGATLSAGSSDIDLEGDWKMDGGVFDPGTGYVNLIRDVAGESQLIDGGTFRNLRASNQSTKEITSNISVSRYFNIDAGAFVDGKTSYIFVGQRWLNAAGVTGFDQTGAGTVVFNGSGNQYIGTNNNDKTIFNHLIIQGSGTKYVRDSIFIKGDIVNQSGTNLYLTDDVQVVGTSANNSLTVTGGTLFITGADNFPQSFETINLVGGQVTYYSNSDQNIYPTTYYDLLIRRANSGSLNTKTLTGDIVVNDDLVINDADTELDVAGFHITLNDGLGLATGGPQIAWNGGKITHVGGSWSIDRDIYQFNEVVKKGSGWITLNVNTELTGDMVFFDQTHLNMQAYTLNCTAADKEFSMGAGSILYSYVEIANGPAFPQGFTTYTLDETNRTYLRGNNNQEIFTVPAYGTLYLFDNVSKTVEINNNLVVRGDFYMYYDGIVLNDNGFDLYLGGAANDIRNYAPTSTVHFNRDGDQNIYSGGSYTTLTLNNVEVQGTGNKNFNEPTVDINGDIIIQTDATFLSDDNINFSGSTLTNAGTISHTNRLFKFDGADQIINPGANNQFYGIDFDGSGTKTITTNGLDVNNGLFEIFDGVTVDMGALTHTLAPVNFNLYGTAVWNVSAANLIFDRNGAQNIPAITANNVTFDRSNRKYLTGPISVNDLTISNGVRLSADATNNGNYPITLSGNWLNEGSFDAYLDTVFFESTGIEAKTIQSGNVNFNVIMFNQNSSFSRTYTLLDNMRFRESMKIGDGATIDLSGNTLTVGNNDPAQPSTPYYPINESITVDLGGTLLIDGGATLQFDLTDGNPQLNVNGTLSVLGDPGLNANITRSAGYNNRGIEVNINSGAKVNAQNYHFQYIAPSGFTIKDGAIIDDVNNFSNGIWSNMYTGTQYTSPNDGATIINSFTYLNIEGEVSPTLNSIDNVTFNHSGTPTIGTHYNVIRGAGATNPVNFGGAVSGLLGGETFELDPDGNVHWPPVSLLTWTGAQSTNWFDANNWSPAQVPTSAEDVLIPLVANNPIIYLDGAQCASIEITNGILSIETGVTAFDISGTLLIGDNGILAVEDDATINILGNWNIATNGVFLYGNSTVNFNSTVGSVIINANKAEFNNLSITGTASFFLEGLNNTINGNLLIANGQFIPNRDNYELHIKGDYTLTGGEFVFAQKYGFVNFSGADQSITEGFFNKVKFTNGGTKTIQGNFETSLYSNNYNVNSFIIESPVTVVTAPGTSMELNGNVSIEAGASFDDGGQTHQFDGRFWTNHGAYLGNGTILFKGRTQEIYQSTFHHLVLSEEAGRNDNKYLREDIVVNGDLTLEAAYFHLDVNTITNSGSGNMTQSADSRLYVKGVDNYPVNFNSYSADLTSFTYYNGAVDQTIRSAEYGNLYIDGSNTKTLEGEITVKWDLFFIDRTGLTLDANNHAIYISGNWENRYSGIFLPGTGEVIFEGSVNQGIFIGTSASNEFYRLTIDMIDNTRYTRIVNTDLQVNNQLSIYSGGMYTNNGYTTTVSGSMIAQNDGYILNSGAYVLNKASGNSSLQVNGSILSDLSINSGGTYTLLDNLDVTGKFEVVAGTFDGNGQQVLLGNYLDVINIFGTYKVGAGGTLGLGDRSTFTVKNGGVVEVIGGGSNVAMVTNRTGRYYFTVENGGSIAARDYTFQYMREAGVKISDGAIIDATNNFSRGTFANPASGGSCLWIENTQSFENATRIEDVSFPDNPGNGTVNVRKNSSSTGVLEFYNATGALAGSNYENDAYNLIFWTGDVTLTWTGAKSTSDWFDADNWSSTGAHKFPDENSNVIIPNGPTSFPVIDMDNAIAKSVTIDAGGFMSINNPTATATSLSVKGDLTINGTLTLTNAEDTIDVNGNWSRGTNGILNPGLSTVRFVGVGATSINNRNSSFYNVEIDIIGSCEISTNTSILNDFTILNGSFDVSTQNRDLVVGGDFSVQGGSFIPRSGQVQLNGSGASTIDLGNSHFYDLEIKNGSYSLLNNLQVDRNIEITSGSLDLAGLILFAGDDSGYDNLSVSGVLNVNDNASIVMGHNTSLAVNAGGWLNMVGTENNESLITRRSAGRYSFTVNSGGTFAANYYKVEYIDGDGITFKAGALLDEAGNNLSNGSFSFGESGGRYLCFENNTIADTVFILNTFFNEGPLYNVKRDEATTTGILNFKDALGVKAGYFFEDDNNASQTGALVWTYTDPTLTWVGGASILGDPTGVRWDNSGNWIDVNGDPGVPSATTQVFIYDVSAGSNVYPLLNGGLDTVALNITIYSGAKLTLGGNIDLNIIESLINSGTLEIESASESTIEVGGQYANNGDFIHGGASTLLWKTVNNATLSTGGDPFYNFIINSGGDGSGTANFLTESSVVVEGNFEVEAGNVIVTNNAHQITVGGDFKSMGTFTHGNGTVLLNGSVAQEISSPTPLSFYRLELSGSGAKTMACDVNLAEDLIMDAPLVTGNNNIDIKGDWDGNSTFTAGTGTVSFTGSNAQRIKKNETFNNLVVNNTTIASSLSFSKAVTVNGALTLTDGIVETSTLTLGASSSVASYSEASYINGSMKKIGDTDFEFPIGTASYLAPLKISDFAGASSTFSVGYFDLAPSNRTLLQEGLNNVSEVEYWALNRLAGTGEPKVSLFWLDKVRSGISNVDVLTVSQYNTSATQWENRGMGVLDITSPADSVSGTITSISNLNSFGNLTFGFAYPTYVWDPTGTSDWEDPANWLVGGSPASEKPSENTNVSIPDIAGGTVPVIAGLSKQVYNLNIDANGALDLSANASFNVLGSGNVDAGGNLTLGDNATICFAKDLDVLGTVNNGVGSSFNFCGNLDQVINLPECYNLIVSGADNKTLSGDLVVLGDINIQSTLSAAANTITLSGNWLNTGTFNYGTGSVILNGTSAQTISGPPTGGFYNLGLNNTFATSPQVRLNSNILIHNNLDLSNGIMQSLDGGRKLSFNSNAAYTNGSEASFVEGMVSRTGSADFIFPLGRDTLYMPIGVSGLVSSITLNAEFFNEAYSDLSNRDAGLVNISGLVYWDMHRTSGVADPFVTLYWDDNIEMQITDPANLLVAHYDAGAWRNMGNAANILNGDKSGFVTSSIAFDTWSPITLASSDDSNPLPIDLLTFDANVVDNEVHVTWTTATEENNSHFEIERMDANENTEIIDVLFGTNWKVETSYKVIDSEPLVGTSYYRLKQYDYDGELTNFNWVSVAYNPFDIDNKLLTAEVSPNLGSAQAIVASITSFTNKNVTLSLLNLSGEAVFTKEYRLGSNEYKLDFRPADHVDLSQGMYILQVNSGKEIQQVKFVVSE